MKDKVAPPSATPPSPILTPPPPALIVFIFKSVYCDYNGFPTKQKLLTSKILDIETIKKGTNRQGCTKNSAEASFF